MKRNKLITVAALAVLAIACSESVGGMLEDAGQMMMDAGDVLQPDAGAQDTPVQCNKQSQNPGTETKNIWHWAEFDVANPGQTEVTVCYRYNGWPWDGRLQCSRAKAAWFEGTNTGIVSCGFEYEDRWDNKAASITVHN